jgi:phage host-nuclease inhibitor protein Gam
MKKSTRIKETITAPATRAEAEALMNEIALTVNNQRKLTAQMDATILAVREKYAESLSLCEDGVKLGMERMKLWALQNEREFGHAKSVQFAAGTIGFRTGMPEVALLNRQWTWKKALEAVEAFLPAFIRKKPEIDKEAIVAQREDAKVKAALPRVGLAVVQYETFYVDPKLETVQSRQVSDEKKEAA